MTDKDLVSFEQPLGRVEAYDERLHRALVRIERGELHEGDVIQIVGPTDDLVEAIKGLMVDEEPVRAASEGDLVAIRVPQRVEVEDDVYIVH